MNLGILILLFVIMAISLSYILWDVLKQMNLVFNRMVSEDEEIKRLKVKMKFYNPTIHELSFGKRISWELRKKQLTDKEVEELFKDYDKHRRK